MHKKNNKVKFRIFVGSTIIISIFLSCFLINKNFNMPNIFLKDSMLWVDNFFGSFFHSFNNKDYNDLVLENERLKHELDLYKSYESVNNELNAEILKLKDVVKINNVFSDSVYVNGSVINRSFDYWQEKLLIDVGLKDGISNNMAVVSGGSLIGITSEVSNSNSFVTLLCNKKFPVFISVKIQIEGDYVYGILNNYNISSNSFEVVGVVENVNIPQGSMVVTTGLGNIFPSGILVGYVDSVTTDNFDLSKVINVRPNVNFDDISYVTVLKRDDK